MFLLFKFFFFIAYDFVHPSGQIIAPGHYLFPNRLITGKPQNE